MLFRLLERAVFEKGEERREEEDASWSGAADGVIPAVRPSHEQR
jgi:hypothetical protein